MNKFLISFLISLMLPIIAWGANYDWGENFSWSIEVTQGDKTYYNVKGLGFYGEVFEPDEEWVYDKDELDENGFPLVGPFMGICDGFDSQNEIIEAYLEWEDEDGNVGKDPLDIMVKDDNSFYLYNNDNERFINDYSENTYSIPCCISLHRNCKNTVKIISKKSSERLISLNFNFNPEYNGHPLYDDCYFMKCLKERTFFVYHYSTGDQGYLHYKIPGTILSKYPDDVDFEYLFYEVYDYNVSFTPDKISRPGNYDIDVSLHDLEEWTTYELWGTNLQFDLDGGGTIEFTPLNKETQTVSGSGLIGGLHINNSAIEDFILKIYPNPGKQLASVKLIYENGIDDEKTEVLLNTEYNEELNCYEVVDGEGYAWWDGFIEINYGWMNTIVARFKDAEPLVLADDDSEKPAEEKNSALIKAKDGVLTNVVLSGRTLYKDNSYNTLCLPFSLTKDEIASSPLSGAIICTLNSGSVNRNLEYDNVWHVNLTFKPVTAIEAGKPYIVKWEAATDNITNPLFENVIIAKARNIFHSADGHVVFTGYYDAFTATPNDDPMIYYLTDNNDLKYTASDRVLKACRAYFTFTPGDDSGSADGFTFDIDFGNGEETGIATVLPPKGEANGHWYTLDGRRLNGKPTVKGVYINNGQKVVVK